MIHRVGAIDNCFLRPGLSGDEVMKLHYYLKRLRWFIAISDEAWKARQRS
jgi:hypothetical protein